MENRNTVNAVHRWLILLGILFVIFLGLRWLATHAFIELSATGTSGSDKVTFSYTNNATDESKSISVPAGQSVKKFVRRGSYEVEARQANHSYFKVISSGGFLGTTKADLPLHAENQRTFVGDNPDTCFSYNGSVLYSYRCGDYFSNMRVHTPASAKHPTFTSRKETHLTPGNIEGLVPTPNGLLAFIYSSNEFGDSDEATADHIVQVLDNKLSTKKEQKLTALDGSKAYTVKPLGDGFVAYSAGFTDVRVFQSINAGGEQLPSLKQNDSQLQPAGLAFGPDSTIAFYSSDRASDETEIDESQNQETLNEVVVLRGQAADHFTLNGKFAYIKPCGDQKICALKGSTLEVYQPKGDKLELLYSVAGVSFMENIGNELLLVKSNGVKVFDVEKREGYISYSLSSSTFCGVQVYKNDFVLCLAGFLNKKVALYVDRNAENTADIDKKILRFKENAEVLSVSVYRNRIFYTTKHGDLVYDKKRNIYTYDKTQEKTIRTRVEAFIDTLGIDRNTYEVINTFE